ncbi:MAG: lytic transglycosylase domain-containing protein [Muribaculaceae bacterium]|nr:lytic transglycosylase domain-containing protein [Muribaculaceae bacterium]
MTLLALAACNISSKSESTAAPVRTADGEATHLTIVSPQLPQSITFGDQRIDFDRVDMWERLDRELTSLTYSHGNTLLMLKRANKYFPEMAPILKKNGMPQDLLYLACVESTLDPLAYSPAKAAGFWQFIPDTARAYGLEVNNFVDERYNLEKATDAACRFLKKSYNRYGNWESVASSYNRGVAGINRDLESQGETSTFDIYLNRETSRYMFRILATKLIMENPEQYGFHLEPEQLYQPVATRTIEVDYTIDNLPAWAKKQGSNYQWLRELNPWLRDKSLPNKSGKLYKIKLPANNDAIYSSRQEKQYFNLKK